MSDRREIARVERINKLIGIIKQDGDFSMQCWFTCGTPSCIAGWCWVLGGREVDELNLELRFRDDSDEFERWSKNVNAINENGAKYLGISLNEAARLFSAIWMKKSQAIQALEQIRDNKEWCV